MKSRFSSALLLLIVMAMVWPCHGSAAQNDQCVQELIRLQKEFHRLMGLTGGPDSFNPSVMDTDYSYRRSMPQICRKQVNELTRYNAEMRAKLERERRSGRKQIPPPSRIKPLPPEMDEEQAPASEPAGQSKCTPMQVEKMFAAGFPPEEIRKICGVTGQPGLDESAGDILQQVAEAYAACATYVDQGVQYTKWIKPEEPEDKKAFRTAFIRPEHLRFEYAARWKSGLSNMIVYMDGNAIQSKWNRRSPNIRPETSLTTALAGTGWIGALIPRLLLPAMVESWSILQLKSIEREADETFDGKACYRIKGHHPSGSSDEPIQLWIDKQTRLILKIERISKSKDYFTRETTIFNPYININLTAAKLDFENGAKLTSADLETTVPSAAADTQADLTPDGLETGQAPDYQFGPYHALVIGNQTYRHYENLKTAEEDARQVAALLKDAYGFDVKLLLDATRKQIIDALDDLRYKLKDRDNLLIYYAGHGNYDPSADRGYWLPVDAHDQLTANWISNTTVTDTLKSMRARHILVVADSCYAGTLTRSVVLKPRYADYIERGMARRSRSVLTSGGLEPVDDAGGGGHSVFAKYFIQTLQENQDIMDGVQLFTRIERPVKLNARTNQSPKYADIRQAGHEDGEFFFVRRKQTGR
jgi:hypothetical protein